MSPGSSPARNSSGLSVTRSMLPEICGAVQREGRPRAHRLRDPAVPKLAVSQLPDAHGVSSRIPKLRELNAMFRMDSFDDFTTTGLNLPHSVSNPIYVDMQQGPVLRGATISGERTDKPRGDIGEGHSLVVSRA